MSELDNIRKQKAEAERRRLEVIDYEKRQVEAEQQRQQQKQRAEAELARLNEREASERWKENMRLNAELVRQNNEAISHFQKQIDEIISEITSLVGWLSVDDIKSTFYQQQENAFNAVGQMEEYEAEKLRAQPHASDTIVHYQMGFVLRQRHRGIQPALSLNAALIEKISNAPDDKTRRVYQAIGFMLTGILHQSTNNLSREQIEDMVKAATIPKANL